jgi:hypothetical protein
MTNRLTRLTRERIPHPHWNCETSNRNRGACGFESEGRRAQSNGAYGNGMGLELVRWLMG